MAATVDRMSSRIAHRGPDDSGHWLDEQAGIALGQRRLSIIDLSPAGHQPMISAGGRYAIVFNGEIYNYPDLRFELESSGAGPAWRGHSDTEVLLSAIEAWGFEAALKKAVGMFAVALWDREQRTLSLARDRIGEKPLYYGWQGNGRDAAFLFASELKALQAFPAFEGQIDKDVIGLFLRHSYIPTPYSIYKGISKLRPGTIATVSLTHREPIVSTYWSVSEVTRKGLADPFKGSPDDAVEQLDSLLRTSVRGQMVSDVPLGAFLSGGVDSSTIVALMQAQSARPVKTFTIGFAEDGYNEAEQARAVARHLGTDHTELFVSPDMAIDVIPKLSHIYDEPFADSSQIPTFLVSQLARQQVTVSLSGDGGDELFGGYTRYALTEQMWSRLSALPLAVRRALASGITAVKPAVWTKIADSLSSFTPRSMQFANVGDKLHKAAGIIDSRSIDDLYLGLVSHWRHPSDVTLSGTELPTLLHGNNADLPMLNDVGRMMALDSVTYLPDDILTKVDRAAMAVSLESRIPLLDHRIIEFAWRLPTHMKIRSGQTKWPLRQVLYRYVPPAMIERPKTGFGLPLDSWFRGPLREWCDELLNEHRLRQQGYFDPSPIRKLWEEHQTGKRNWSYQLWNVLIFQSWLARA